MRSIRLRVRFTSRSSRIRLQFGFRGLRTIRERVVANDLNCRPFPNIPSGLAAGQGLPQHHLFTENIRWLDPYLIRMRAIPRQDLLGAKLARGMSRLMKHGVRNDHGKRGVQQVVETPRSCQGNKRWRIRNDDGDLNRHDATVVAATPEPAPHSLHGSVLPPAWEMEGRPAPSRSPGRHNHGRRSLRWCVAYQAHPPHSAPEARSYQPAS